MGSRSTHLTPEGPGSVSGAPNLPAGFTDTFTNRYIDTDALRLHAVIGTRRTHPGRMLPRGRRLPTRERPPPPVSRPSRSGKTSRITRFLVSVDTGRRRVRSATARARP